jgi:hypothetical protein
MRPDRIVGKVIARTPLGTDPLTAALFYGDQEVVAGGYRPAPIRKWHVHDPTAHAVIRFGPQDEPHPFDRYVIIDGDQAIKTVPEESCVSLPRRMEWDWRLELDLGAVLVLCRPSETELAALCDEYDAA